MRAGTQVNPHTLTRRYLDAARRIGLPREWAQRHLVWLSRTIDSLWPMEQTRTADLEQRAMCRENADNLSELALHQSWNRETLQQRRDTLALEIVSDQILLARIDRELEDCAR